MGSPGCKSKTFKYGDTCKLKCRKERNFEGPGVYITCLGDDEWGDILTGQRDKWSGGDCWTVDELHKEYLRLPRPTLEERKCNHPDADQTKVDTIKWDTPRGTQWSEAEKKEVKQMLYEAFYKDRGANVASGDPNAERKTAARVIRLGFHDCVKSEDGSGGCDGCIDMKNINYRHHGGKDARGDESLRTKKPDWLNGNRGLETIVDFIERNIFTRKLASSKGRSLQQTGKSRADLWAFATLVAIEFTNGVDNVHCDNPHKDEGSRKVVCLQDNDKLRGCKNKLPRDFVFQTGRRDCKTNLSPAYSAPKRDLTPSGDLAGGQLTAWMKKYFHFTGKETVAIMGAHSVGNFHPEVSGYFYTVTSQAEDALSNQYYRNLASFEDWFFEPSVNRNMTKSYYNCRKSGTADGKRAKAYWKMKAQAAWTDHSPIQWIQHKVVCPNCEWAEHETWPNSFPPSQQAYVRQACKEYEQCQKDGSCEKRDKRLQAQNIIQCKPGTEYERFIWGRDEAATNADMSLYYDFLVDQKGFPYNCPLLDKEQGEVFTSQKGTGKGSWDFLHKQSNQPQFHGCGLQKHMEPCGSTPLYQIVEEFAEDKEKWLAVFVPTLEKMLRNGYADGQLRDNGGINGLQVTGSAGEYSQKI